MEHLKQPKRELTLEIMLEGEEKTHNYRVFLGEFSRSKPGPQDPDDFFNESNQYIPARNIDTEQMEFLNIKKILWARYELDQERFDEDKIPGIIKNIVVRMEAKSISGLVEIMLPPEKSRITDFINQEERFFLLKSEDGFFIINKDQAGSISD